MKKRKNTPTASWLRVGFLYCCSSGEMHAYQFVSIISKQVMRAEQHVRNILGAPPRHG